MKAANFANSRSLDFSLSLALQPLIHALCF